MSTRSLLGLGLFFALLFGTEVICASDALPAVLATVAGQSPNSSAVAEGPDAVAKLRAEKATLTKRLAEIDSQLNKIWVGHGMKILGMTLVDPSEDLMKHYQLPEKYPGPIMVKVQDVS